MIEQTGNQLKDEIRDALRPLESLINKSDKALQKLKPGSWQYDTLTTNLKALRLAFRLLSKDGNDLVSVKRSNAQEALDVLTTLIIKVEGTLVKFSPGTSQHTLQQNRLNALRISKSVIQERLEGPPVGHLNH